MTSHFLACLLPCSTRACGRQWRTRTRWLSRACCPKTTSTVAWGEGGACGREKIGKRRIGWKRGREGWTGWVTRVWFPSMLLPLPTIPLCSTCCQRQEQDIILFVSEPSEKKNKETKQQSLWMRRNKVIDLLFCVPVCQPAEWEFKLDALVALAGKQVEERKMELVKKPGPGPQAQADLNGQVRLWSLRLQLYCRMRENFLKTGQWFGVRLWFVLNVSPWSELVHWPAAF